MSYLNASFFIEIINGKDKGARFQVVSQKVSIGRSKNNDIVLDDPKVSRNHAALYTTPEGLQIICLNPERKVFVGKQDVKNAILELPSIILIGNTKLKATMTSNMPSHLPMPVPPSNLQKGSLQNLQNNNQLMTFQNEVNHSSSSKQTNFYIVVGIVGLLLYFLFSSSKPKKEEEGLVTSEQQEKHLASIQDKVQAIYTIRNNQGKNTSQYREAQALFIQGLRDYREQNYLRAMGYFNGALAIFPQHTLSQRYLQKSRTKQDQLIQLQLLEANRYYEHKQYRQAIASYGQILLLVQDRTNKIYREAAGRREECEAIVQSYVYR